MFNVKLRMAGKLGGSLALIIGLSGCATTKLDDECMQTKYATFTTNVCPFKGGKLIRLRYRF